MRDGDKHRHRYEVQDNSREGIHAVESTVDKANLCLPCVKGPSSIVSVWGTMNVVQSG